MQRHFNVRPIEHGDYDRWQLLWQGYNAFYGRSGATALADDITAMTWSRFFDAYEPVFALVAVSGDELVGLAHYLMHRSTISIAPNCYLQDLFTVEEDRGRGVANALIEAVTDNAGQAGLRSVYWQTHSSNGAAMRLYDKVANNSGFIVYSKDVG
jgi:GNAT superfamily N-acetyltransferase